MPSLKLTLHLQIRFLKVVWIPAFSELWMLVLGMVLDVFFQQTLMSLDLGWLSKIPVASEGKSSAQSPTTRGYGPVGCEQCQSEGYLSDLCIFLFLLGWSEISFLFLVDSWRHPKICIFSGRWSNGHLWTICNLIRPRRLVDGLVVGSNIVLPEFCTHWKLNLWWVVPIDTSRYIGLQYSAYVISRYFHLRQEYGHTHRYIYIYNIYIYCIYIMY